METSLAEDVQEQKMTLLPESFFFMSPYRSFVPRAVLAVFPTPPMARCSMGSFSGIWRPRLPTRRLPGSVSR
jgi:hypothetical protein